MDINVIHDFRRVEKKEQFTYELNRQGIFKFKIWEAVMLPNVVESISESFKMIIRDAQLRELPEVCIMEDDVYMPSKHAWQYFIEHKPKEYDVYLGGNYLLDNRIEYAAPLVKVNEYVGNHCIIVNERYYDTWISTDSAKHCDTEQKGKGEFFVCFPFIALQRSGWSANSQAVVNYNSILPEHYIYK